MTTKTAITKAEAETLSTWIVGLPTPFTLTYKEGKLRGLSQNALMHKWFGEIAQQTHSTADQVKRECKFYQGCPILMADDPEFAGFVRKLAYRTVEEKIAAMDYVAVTSIMTSKQLKTMGDAMKAKYLPQGIILTEPEDRKGEQ